MIFLANDFCTYFSFCLILFLCQNTQDWTQLYILFFYTSSSILFKKKKIIQLAGKVRTRLNHMRCLGHDSEFQYLPRFCTSCVPFALSSPDPELCSDFKCMTSGISLVVQWLRLPSNSGVWVWLLVGEIRSHVPPREKIRYRKQKQYCNNFNKDFKNGPH